MSGTGPLHAREPIVMDIFPQHKTSRYWADMTRTVSKGEPAAEILKMYELVKRAQDAGIKALRPGITGRQVHELVEDIIFAAGYDTLRPGQQHGARENGALPKGFIHGTGHGVGLEITRRPALGGAARCRSRSATSSRSSRRVRPRDRRCATRGHASHHRDRLAQASPAPRVS